MYPILISLMFAIVSLTSLADGGFEPAHMPLYRVPYPTLLEISGVKIRTKSQITEIVSKIPSARCKQEGEGATCLYEYQGFLPKGFRYLYCMVHIHKVEETDVDSKRLAKGTSLTLTGYHSGSNVRLMGVSQVSAEKKGRDYLECRAGADDGTFLRTPLSFFNELFSVTHGSY